MENTSCLVYIDITPQIQLEVTSVFQEDSGQAVFLNGGAGHICYRYF